MRKIINIAFEDGDPLLICDDGTVWVWGRAKDKDCNEWQEATMSESFKKQQEKEMTHEVD